MGNETQLILNRTETAIYQTHWWRVSAGFRLPTKTFLMSQK